MRREGEHGGGWLVLGLLARHGLVTICGAIFLEELGLPLPIPTDILIVSAGATGGSAGRFVLWFVLISLASASGASGLYAAVRRGGRPLVERFGRYVHLGPTALARGEALLLKGGWGGIALGRATPGLRLPTVIVCGLLGIPYRRFITAHIVGSAVYILVFLALGRLFGVAVLERLHFPGVSVRFVSYILLGIGLPTLLAWLCVRAHIQREEDRPAGRTVAIGAAVLGGLAGTIAFAATWAAGFAATDLARTSPPLTIGYRLARRLLGRPEGAFLLANTLLLLGGVALGVLYLEVVLPRLARRLHTLPGQILGLALLTFALDGGLNALVGFPGQRRAPLTIAILLALGSLGYATTVACARALALALRPASGRASGPSDDPGIVAPSSTP